MKKLLIILASIVLFISLIWISINAISQHIYSCTDCQRFNIDNIELRTHIDIPALKVGKTKCDSNGKVKKASFLLDLNSKDLEIYIKKNKFVKEGDLYISRGEQADTKWKVVLNPINLELNVQIEYLK